MTVANSTARTEHSGNGITTIFSTGFAFIANADVKVILVHVDQTEVVWTEGTEYTLTGAGTGASGTITVDTDPTNYTPLTGEKLVILRDVDFTQVLDANTLDTMPASDLEDALDKLWHALQQVREVQARSLKNPDGKTGVPSVAAWSPTWAIASDGTRRVLQLVDWIGGLGTPEPASPFYIGAGGFVVNIADGVDIRGPAGQAGAGSGDLLAANNLSDLNNLTTGWNNLLTAKTALAARAAGTGGLNIEALVSTGDANVTLVAADHALNFTTALTAARTATLAAANAVNAGHKVWIFVPSGVINGANTISVSRAGSDTIQGVPGGSTTTFAFTNPRGGWCELISNGSNAWHLGQYRGLALKHTISIPATALQPVGTLGPAFEDQTLHCKSLWFDPSTAEQAFIPIFMPESWNLGTITFRARWRHKATATNFGVTWKFRARSYADDDALTTSFTNVVSVTDTGGTTDDEYRTAETSGLTPDGTPARGERLNIHIERDPADAGDTLAVDAGLNLIEMYYFADNDTDA